MVSLFLKRFQWLVWVLICSVTGSAFAVASPVQVQTTQEDYGFLILSATHAGLVVRIDGEFVGRTPLGVKPLPAGRHEVQVTHPDRDSWLERDWVEEIEILPDDTLRLAVRFTRSYSINSQPYGATVLLDGMEAGETPLHFTLPEETTREVRLTLAGYQDTTFTIGSEARQFYEITLRRDLEYDMESKVEGMRLEKRAKFKKRALVALGVAVASGAAAFYFRNKADNSFDRYLETGDPQIFNRHFDDAEKFDKFAAVSFGTFQISFIVSFYYFLRQANL